LTTRKDFLAASSLFALAPAAAGAATPSPSPSPRASAKRPPLTFTFDRSRFDEILAKPAKHKQCFAATSIEDGGVMFAMNNSIDAYENFLKEGAGAMQAVAVLYHGPSIFMAMNDAAWNEILTPFFKNNVFRSSLPPDHRKDFTSLKLGKGNPFLHSETKDPDDVSIERLASKGSSFFVCHNALAGWSHGISRTLKMSAQDVHRRLMSSIVPSALVVPAGVMAINACQEAKFTYIQSSL
jgi:intracellular sulfur oxidation DsrE/DsrF family protein